VTIHPLETRDGVLVKVEPPAQPLDSSIDHISCDIVLVIDVSASMGEFAPVPGEVTDQDGREKSELTSKFTLNLD
jgi:hypothetical protein